MHTYSAQLLFYSSDLIHVLFCFPFNIVPSHTRFLWNVCLWLLRITGGVQGICEYMVYFTVLIGYIYFKIPCDISPSAGWVLNVFVPSRQRHGQSFSCLSWCNGVNAWNQRRAWISWLSTATSNFFKFIYLWVFLTPQHSESIFQYVQSHSVILFIFCRNIFIFYWKSIRKLLLCQTSRSRPFWTHAQSCRTRRYCHDDPETSHGGGAPHRAQCKLETTVRISVACINISRSRACREDVRFWGCVMCFYRVSSVGSICPRAARFQLSLNRVTMRKVPFA